MQLPSFCLFVRFGALVRRQLPCVSLQNSSGGGKFLCAHNPLCGSAKFPYSSQTKDFIRTENNSKMREAHHQTHTLVSMHILYYSMIINSIFPTTTHFGFMCYNILSINVFVVLFLLFVRSISLQFHTHTHTYTSSHMIYMKDIYTILVFRSFTICLGFFCVRFPGLWAFFLYAPLLPSILRHALRLEEF